MIIVSPTKANTLKCNFFFKNVAGSQVFTRALFVQENETYRVDLSLADHNPYLRGESALSWETPFINDTFFQKSIYPKVKKHRNSTGLDWTLPHLWVPSGHTSSVNFHVSIRTKVSNGQTNKKVIMDAMSDIDTSAYYSVTGECDEGSAEVIRVLKSGSKTSSSSSSTNSKLNKVKSLCKELGFRSGTEKHGDCVMKLIDN